MSTLATLQKIVKVSFNNSPASVARQAGLSDHLVAKAESYNNLLSFLAVLDKGNTAQVANWLDSLADE